MMDHRLQSILDKPFHNQPLTGEDIVFILELHRKDDIEALFNAAREMRDRHFGDKVFLYGFLYISTYCRNNCNFCFYRVSNTQSPRYRKEEEEVLAAAAALAGSGVHLVDITLGEDPEYFNSKGRGFESFIHLVKRVKEVSDLPVMVSPGVVPGEVLEALAGVGVDWFACYQETHNRELFRKLRPGQSYETRFEVKGLAHQYGLLTEEGILVGVGEEVEDIVKTVEAVRFPGFAQVRAMNFVPQGGTPMGGDAPPEPLRELLIIALLRLVFPDRLIPATLDVEGLDGLKRRLDAGANVVTSIVPPSRGLAGVAQSVLDIDDARRTTESVLPVLADCGLQPAAVEEYLTWVVHKQKFLEVRTGEPFFKKVPGRRRQ